MEHKIIEDLKNEDLVKEHDPELLDFYAQPEFMQIISQHLAEFPQIDRSKVAEIKQALQTNNLALDHFKLAEAITKFELELFKNIDK